MKDYKVRFTGERNEVRKAMKAMQDFNSIMPVPKGMSIYKMVPVSEDYFYYLLSGRGLVSKIQGDKSLARFEKETEDMDKSLVVCYKEFAKYMIDNLDKYGACTADAWKQMFWEVTEQPKVKILNDYEIILCNATKYPKAILDRVCSSFHVTAKLIE